jgi:hypothetical protein
VRSGIRNLKICDVRLVLMDDDAEKIVSGVLEVFLKTLSNFNQKC